jgi:serine/threonine protein kinase
MSFIREANAEPIPGYRLIEPLGTGGYGEVWKCEAPGGLFKAIKFVYGNLNSMDTDAARAEQEQDALNRIKEVRHPFVLSIEQIKVVEGELVIITELADKNLNDLLLEHQAAGLVGIPREDLLRYLRDAAEALDHMNEKHKLQHLDIKPRNLFLISDRVKVADFGLVKHLERQSGMLASVTPLYAAPETFNGKISEYSDQYSLAIVYYELLTGQRPFSGKNARQLAIQHTQQEPELRALPEAERPVLARALAKDPTKRYPNCLAFVKALYNARPVVKAETVAADEQASTGVSPRPKTMSETLEDIFLEQHGLTSDEGRGARDEEEAVAGSPLATRDSPLINRAGGLSEEDENVEEVSQLGLTMHQPQTGVLRPTLILGLGSFGRRALLELRCRFLDRFGDLSKIPLVHFLYVDTDSDAVRNAARGSMDVSALPNEVYHLPLQPVGNYRRRMLDHLNDWLPREKLYNLPRSLQTQGSRALGRLAFADNHLRFMARLRKEVEQIAHPDTLYQSVSQTGLALRNNLPRIYVLAAAGGGSGGLLIDLGFALRRLVHTLRHSEADVIAMLFCGAPEDPATPRLEQANVYATLTELNHFADTGISFTAQYGPDGPKATVHGQPFTNVYLLKLAHRSPESLRDAVAHLGSYLFHELTTPLGLRLDQNRRKKAANGTTGFRSFGTYAVWFPRGLLLRMAGRQACVRLLNDWQVIGEPTAQVEVEAGCARALADPELRFEAVCGRLEKDASVQFDNNLVGALTGLLATLETQSQQTVALDDPAGWSQHSLDLIQEFVGVSFGEEHGSGWRRSRLGRALSQAINKLAGEWDEKLSQAAFGLMEHPGRRVAAAEAALKRFAQFCQDASASHAKSLEQQVLRSRQAREHLDAALQNCKLNVGGFVLFGNRVRRFLKVFMDYLAAFGRQRLAEEIITAGVQFFGILHGKIDERIRDLAFCRQRLRSLQDYLAFPPDVIAEATTPIGVEVTPVNSPFYSAEAYWEAIRQSATARLVLPEGQTELEQAAERFLASLKPEQWVQVDQALQDGVLASLGGLHKVCVTGSDLSRLVSRPMIGAAAGCLGDFLPITDVAEAEFTAPLPPPGAEQQVTGTGVRGHGSAHIAGKAEGYFASAAPLVAAAGDKYQQAFLLVPASDAGKCFGDEAAGAVPSLELIRAPGQADLMFCREQGSLTIDDLRPLLRACRQAYDQSVPVPVSSPHARFDIVDWVPIDP